MSDTSPASRRRGALAGVLVTTVLLAPGLFLPVITVRGMLQPHGLAELAPKLAANSELTQAAASGEEEAIVELGEVRTENAELEFLQLRLAELPEGYQLDGDNLKGPEGTLLPKALTETLPDRIHQNKQVYGRFVSLDDTARHRGLEVATQQMSPSRLRQKPIAFRHS